MEGGQQEEMSAEMHLTKAWDLGHKEYSISTIRKTKEPIREQTRTSHLERCRECMKRCSISSANRECKIKPEGAVGTRLSEELRQKILTPPNTLEKPDYSFVADS